jgi:DNA (cytosine-5)-methyltransferase 1
MKKLRVLDLFSGIGGFSLGLERTGGFETVAFCEIEEFPRKVLAKHWPDVPCFHDVRKLTRADIDGPVDVICGGYPCQPFSTAGRRLGQKDDRHLWPEFARIVEEFRPTWVIGENVAGHISMGLDDVLSDLEALGYAARPFVIPACAVNALHRRDRVWTIGHSDKNSFEQRKAVAIYDEAKQHDIINFQDAADTASIRQSGSRASRKPSDNAEPKHRQASIPFNAMGRPTQSAICGRNDGVPNWLVKSRLAALGNAVVPQIPELIGHAILEAERQAA